jgi:hypothetical protein
VSPPIPKPTLANPIPPQQLGIGTNTDATTPAAVTGLPAGGVTAAAASSGQLLPYFR